MSPTESTPDALSAIKSSGYQLKNVRTLNTHDGIAWNATLYKDGVKVGHAENGGRVGPSFVQFLNNELAETFKAWTDTLPDIEYPACEDMEAFTIPTNGESVMDTLFAAWEDEKERKKFDKKARTHLLFRTTADSELQYRTITIPGTDPNSEEIRARFRAQAWWGTVTQVWVIGQGWPPVNAAGQTR